MCAAHDLPNSHKNLRNVLPVAVDIVVVSSAGASPSHVASRRQAGRLAAYPADPIVPPTAARLLSADAWSSDLARLHHANCIIRARSSRTAQWSTILLSTNLRTL